MNIKQILEFPQYSITSSGEVVDSALIKLPSFEKNGYQAVSIGMYEAYIHILVARYFVPNPDLRGLVKHLDGNKSNNFTWNIGWDGEPYSLIKTGFSLITGE